MKTPDEIISFNQANMDALIKSSQIVATGLQDMSRMVAASMQSTMDETMSAFRAMSGVRSIREAMDLQTSLARSTVEKAVTQSGQVAQTSLKLAEQAMAPIANRVTVAVDTFKPA